MTDTGTVVNLLDLDAEILRQRLNGTSIRRLAREFKIPEYQVLQSLDRSLPPISAETRVRLYREDLCRLDDMLTAFYPQAKNGMQGAATICLKLLERRSAMTGSDAPQRVDVTVKQAAEEPNSTIMLLNELNRIAAERDPKTIEGEPIGEVTNPDQP
jgi:hypothetical protein